MKTNLAGRNHKTPRALTDFLILASLSVAAIALLFLLDLPERFLNLIGANANLVVHTKTIAMVLAVAFGIYAWLRCGELISETKRRREVEQALHESNKFSISLLENAPNPIVVVNPDTSIQYVNLATERLTGFSALELVGKKPPDPEVKMIVTLTP